MSWAYVPASEDLNSDCRWPSQVLTQFASLSKTDSVSVSLANAGQTCPSGATCSPLTLNPGPDISMLSQLDSHVSPGAAPEASSAPKMSGTCSQPLRKSFAWWDQSLSSWRTFQGSLLEADYPLFSEAWPKWGSLRNMESFPAAAWEPLTCEDASSSSPGTWPTPKACNADKGGRPRENDRGDLCAASKRWPLGPLGMHYGRLWNTPTACEDEGTGFRTRGDAKLKGQIKQWTTPTARDWRSGKSNQTHNTRPLSEVVERYGPQAQSTTGAQYQETSGRLNSRFVEWLMGFPPGWTVVDSRSSLTENQELRHWETLLAHLLRQWVGGSSKVA